MKFMEKNWDRCISLLLIVAAIVLYFCNIPESWVKHLLFWIMMGFSLGVNFISDETMRRVIGISIPIISVVFLLLLSAWQGVLISTLAVLVLLMLLLLRFMDKVGVLLFVTVMASWSVCCLFLGRYAQEAEFLATRPKETMILQSVYETPKQNVYVSLEGEGGSIFKVSSKVAKDWDYQAGDTVKVIICGDKVISCEK